MACSKTSTGRTKVAYWAVGDCTDDPTSTASSPLTYKPLGGVQSTSVSKNYRESTANSESTTFTETIAIGLDYDISISCLDWEDEDAVSSQDELTELADNAYINGTTPTIWYMEVDKVKNKRTYYFVTPKNPTVSSEIEGNRTTEFQLITQPTYSETNKTVQSETGVI
jgi:hypothetical protein